MSLDRRAVVRALLADRRDDLVIAGLGAPAWDVAAAGDDPRNFYLWGGMGGAAMVGLGLALAQPTRRVLVITGDGEMLMGLGSLATIAQRQPANLAIIVLDNGRFGETGMQPSHTAGPTDLAAVAAGCGLRRVHNVHDEAGLETLIQALSRRSELIFARVGIAVDDVARVLPEKDGVVLKQRFRAAVARPPGASVRPSP